jgi:hypothetical protein
MTAALLLLAALQTSSPAAGKAPDYAALPADEFRAETVATLPWNQARRDYFRRLSPEDQKLFGKAVLLGELDRRGGPPYVFLYKRGGKFCLEACSVVPSDWPDALPVARELKSYGSWVFKGINARKGGGKYFVDLDSMEYLEDVRNLRVKATLNVFWKGKHSVRLAAEDRLSEPSSPHLLLRLARPSRLASSAAGDFRVYPLPGEQAFLLYFMGEAELHWLFYYMMPLGLIQGEVVERTGILLDNIRSRLAEKGRSYRPASSSSR